LFAQNGVYNLGRMLRGQTTFAQAAFDLRSREASSQPSADLRMQLRIIDRLNHRQPSW
jgi:hypothetical protein